MKKICRMVVLALLFAVVASARPAVALDRYSRMNENVVGGVRRALEREPGVDYSKIDVWLWKGVVHLTGSVESRQARERAANAARSVTGVGSVDASELQVVEFQGGASDTGDVAHDGNGRNLRNRVESALRRSRIDVSCVTVDATNGRVNLFGTVPPGEAKSIAVAVAYSVEGVENVDSSDLRTTR